MNKWLVGVACAWLGLATAMDAMGQYIVNFEGDGETKTAYATATVSLSGKNWDMTDALIGTTSGSDWFNGLRSARMRGYGTSAMTMLADVAEGVGTLSFSYRRYGTDAQVDWKVEYSINGGTSWTQVGASFTALASDEVQTFSESINSSGSTRIRIKRATETGTVNARLNIDDITMTAGGPAVFGVTFDKSEGFQIVSGAGAAITATAANGTPAYTYAWTSSMLPADYTAVDNVFTVNAAAPLGSYWARVVATDSTAASVTNTINFSVVAAPTKYAITITPPVNGTVTTTPATEAEAGQNVTINATPAGGYAVDTYSVVGADTTVIGNTSSFTMPAQAVTVTVTFKVHVGSALIISEVADPSDSADGRFVELYNAGGSSIDLAAGNWYLARQANGGTTWGNIALTGTVAAGQTYIVAYSASNYPVSYPAAPAPNQISGNINGNGDDGYFLYSGGNSTAGVLEDAYGVINEDGTGMPWEYLDSRAARNANVTAGNPTWTASEWTIASAAVADMTPGVHPDGAAVFSVSFDKTEGFTVEQGTSATITATAANGTAPYGYAWSSSLGATYYSTNANVFTILATAPTGTYSAQVVATDNAAQIVTNSINFSVVPPVAKYAITITPPVNGTVTTTPATEAAAGTTVTINATPAGGYAVGTITVVDAGMNPVTVTLPARTFTMPAAAVIVTVTFNVLSDTATLPTSFSGPGWYQGTGLPGGWTQVGLGTDYATSLDAAGAAAKFDTTADSLQIKYDSAATELSYWLQLNGTWINSNVFKVQESVDGATWTDLAVYDDANPISGTKEQFTNTPNASSRYIQFIYVNKGSGNVGLDGVAITGGGGGATVAIGGDATGTVGAQMDITIALQNAVAADWIIELKDPDNADVTVYNWNPGTGAFSFTPAKSGSYFLAATALDAGSAPIASNSVTLAVSSGANPPIASITFLAGTGFSFQVPDGYTLVRVEGASALSGNAWGWTTLSSPTDYTVSGSTVTILRAPATKRMVRIVMHP